jgi:L-histidine N-alpha-methyltransferase
LNREVNANFQLKKFHHLACWNPGESRIEMHLESLAHQIVTIPATSSAPALTLTFDPGETIHTENSYKFTSGSIAKLLTSSSFAPAQTWHDPDHLFAVTLATAI